jgi:hypothetical protein
LTNFTALKDKHLSIVQQKIQIQVSPAIAYNEQLLKQEVKHFLNLKDETLFVKPLRRSIDARNRNIKVNLTVQVFIDEPAHTDHIKFDYKDVSKQKKPATLLAPDLQDYLPHCVVWN